MKQKYQKFSSSCSLLMCPKCRTGFSVSDGALKCQNGHSYDLAAKGYVHFAPNVSISRYDRALFVSRRRILEGSFYRTVLQVIHSHMDTFAQRTDTLLDAGCGDGTFSKQLYRGGTLIGVDLSKDAIVLAASGGDPHLWMVADLAHLPLQDHTVDVLLNILSPAHYSEFQRVLKPDGILIKVIPNSGYLKELRTLAGQQLKSGNYSNTAVLQHLEERFEVLAQTTVCETHSVTADEAKDFLNMTPMMFHVDQNSLNAAALREVTVDVTVVAARVPRSAFDTESRQ